MAYFLTTEAENAVPPVSLVRPKTHTRLSRVNERGLRYYNPGLGRWIRRDPSGERSGPSQYSAVRNDFVDRSDAIGLDVYIPPWIPGGGGYIPVPLPPDPTIPPPSPVPTGRCRITLECRPVAHSPLDHCFLKCEKSDGSVRACRGGQNGPFGARPSYCSRCCGDFGPVITQCGNYRAGFPDYNVPPMPRTKSTVLGDFDCQKCDCIEHAIRWTGLQCFSYEIRGPNSNTTVYHALSVCGLPTALPPGADAPGWRDFRRGDEVCPKTGGVIF